MVAKLITKTKSALRKVHYKRKANFYFTVTALILLAALYYGTTHYFELTNKAEIASESDFLVKDVSANLDEATQEYETLKDEHNTLRETVKAEVVTVFPESDQYTELTRHLDTYFKSKNTTGNPLVVTNLQYGTAKASEDGNYYILPVSMTISSSEKNFYDFLEYIDKSGSLSSQTRIMDIKSIKINFRNPKGSKESKDGEDINFNVQLNAYFQKLD